MRTVQERRNIVRLCLEKIKFSGELFSLILCVGSLWGCGAGEIDNFAGIRIESERRLGRIEVLIILVDSYGNPLIWNGSILSPGIGANALSVSKFITQVDLYSYRGNVANIMVYSGELQNLRWSHAIGSDIRLMAGEIPIRLIQEDPTRDTDLGKITVTIETDKQGPFSDTLQRIRMYY